MKARTQWSPLETSGAFFLAGNALVMSWGFVQIPPTNPLPWTAVYHSALWGRFTRRLRLCREHECQTPFVWKHSWQQRCHICALVKDRLRHPEVRTVMDRIRKWPNAEEKRAEALADLRAFPIPGWLRKWRNKRRGPQGRPALTYRRSHSTRTLAMPARPGRQRRTPSPEQFARNPQDYLGIMTPELFVTLWKQTHPDHQEPVGR
jgi:hypothetical protein